MGSNGQAIGTRFISLGEFSRLSGLSLNTCRYHVDKNPEIKTYRSLGGHRRIENPVRVRILRT